MLTHTINTPENEENPKGQSLYARIKKGRYSYWKRKEGKILLGLHNKILGHNGLFLLAAFLLLGYTIIYALDILGIHPIITISIFTFLVMLRGMFLIQIESRAQYEYKQFIGVKGEINKMEDTIEKNYQEIENLIKQDASDGIINPYHLEKYRDQIRKVQQNIKNLKVLYDNLATSVQKYFWALDDNSNLSESVDQYEEDCDKKIVSFNNRLKILIESWMGIHSQELNMLDDAMKSDLDKSEDTLGKEVLELQIQRLENYISSIKNITNS